MVIPLFIDGYMLLQRKIIIFICIIEIIHLVVFITLITLQIL